MSDAPNLAPLYHVHAHVHVEFMLSVSTLSSRLAWVCNDNTKKEYQNIEILRSRKRSGIRENIREHKL